MTTATKITSRWTTICTVGYRPIATRKPNESAHGNVCHLQASNSDNGMWGREVNVNGQHEEIGQSFELDAELLARWQTIAASK